MNYKFFKASNIGELDNPSSLQEQPILQYLIPLVRKGASHYAKNTKAQFGLLKLGQHFLPFSYGESHKTPTYLTSLRAQFFLYLIDEIKSNDKYSNVFKACSLPILKLGNLLFKALGADKLVMLNNWLVSTNLVPSIPFLQLKEPLLDLCEEFPKSIIAFKGLNEGLHNEQIQALRKLGFIPVISRLNFVLDVKEKTYLKKRPLAQDRKRWDKQKDLNWFSPKLLNEAQKEIVMKQYEALYLEKYSTLNPKYTPNFLDAALEGQFLRIDLLKQEEEILGVQAVAKSPQELTTPFIGYDQSAPKKLGIYRHLNVNLVNEAEREGKVLNMSSGAGKFKSQRGGTPHFEYHMLYVDHLPWLKRLFWKFFSKFSLKYIKPVLLKNELG